MRHGTDDVACADDLGLPGGRRVVARCRCGWHSRAALSRALAVADLREHLDVDAETGAPS